MTASAPTLTSQHPAIQLSAADLSCYRGERLVFSDLSFMVEGGEILEVAGPNGCGKTTLLRVLCGLLPPETGEIRWCGQPVSDVRSQFLRGLAYVGHADGIKGDLTVPENLHVARALHGGGGLEPEAALQKMGLAELHERLGRFLSAGQRRRLALARLLLNRASLWILDEPYTALDKAAAASTSRLLEEHADQGGIVIFTSHHPVELRHAKVLRLGASP
jgi:heme exporter protein A